MILALPNVKMFPKEDPTLTIMPHKICKHSYKTMSNNNQENLLFSLPLILQVVGTFGFYGLAITGISFQY